jgi:hypothetical protein
LVVALPLVLLVWALTAKEEGNMAWGSVVTVGDQPSADLFGVPRPGAYVGTQRGAALPAVRGGLKLILTVEDPALGMRALTSRLFTGIEGVVVAAGLLLWVLCVVFLAQGASAPGSAAARRTPRSSR